MIPSMLGGNAAVGKAPLIERKPKARSVRADVRNPLLQLPAVAELQQLPAPLQAALRKVLKDISADARRRADECWRKHKAPMAAYWKAVAVYANHASRVLQP